MRQQDAAPVQAGRASGFDPLMVGQIRYVSVGWAGGACAAPVCAGGEQDLRRSTLKICKADQTGYDAVIDLR